jgi:hypothetical protein
MIDEMQPTSQLPSGDWFLFEDHTVIRVYGFTGKPYKLPAFLTPRIFALEYIRQKMSSDEEHFSAKRFNRTFTIPTHLGPFVVFSRQALSLVEEMLADMKFPTVGSATYDPKCMILKGKDLSGKLMEKFKETGENPYHVPQPLLEDLANKRSYIQTVDSFSKAERRLVVRGKRGGDDLTEGFPPEKRTKVEEDIENSLQVIQRARGAERVGEAFTTQRYEQALKSVDPRPQDTPGKAPLDSLEVIYKNIQEQTERLQKKAEQTTSLPDFRFLSAFDAESGIFKMAMLESTKPRGEPVTSAADYKATELNHDMSQAPHTDVQNFHLAAVGMIHRKMNIQHATTEKLQKKYSDFKFQL